MTIQDDVLTERLAAADYLSDVVSEVLLAYENGGDEMVPLRTHAMFLRAALQEYRMVVGLARLRAERRYSELEGGEEPAGRLEPATSSGASSRSTAGEAGAAVSLPTGGACKHTRRSGMTTTNNKDPMKWTCLDCGHSWDEPAAPSPALTDGDVVERIARVLYDQEKRRSEHAGTIISSTGLAIEPYEDHADTTWRVDARAVCAALAEIGGLKS